MQTVQIRLGVLPAHKRVSPKRPVRSRLRRCGAPLAWASSCRMVAAQSGGLAKASSGGIWMWSVDGAVEGPVAADCDADAARLDDQIGVGDALSDRLRSLGLAKLGDAVELRSVEDDIGAQQRDGSLVLVVAPDFELLVEEDDRALFAFADLPAARGRLPVAHPARIAAECARRHGERKRVDAAIGSPCDGVHRTRACGAFLGVPGPPPGEHPVLELRDDGVRQLFVVVAPSDVVPEFLHWAVLSPFLDLNSPSRVASRSPAARARSEDDETSEAARRPHPCGGRRRCDSGLFLASPSCSCLLRNSRSCFRRCRT